MLNRFWKAKADEGKAPVTKRPHLASECQDLAEAERWRGQIIREIGRKVAEVQNGAIGEYKIRDVNDEINKLMREKSHWEKQILKLGGPDYYKTAPRVTDADGRTVVGSGGYMYFGAARNLPGVRELLEKKQVENKKRSRHEIHQHIDMDYYGFRDEDDGLLVELEAKAEQKCVRESIQAWNEEDAVRRKTRAASAASSSSSSSSSSSAAAALDDADDDAAKRARVTVATTSAGSVLRAHVPLPSEDEMRALLLARRKQALLDQLR